MKKVHLLALTLVSVLVMSGVAIAANEYTITSTTNPTKSGTSSRPAPISGTFGFTVRDTNGGRPAALDALTVRFTGLRINTRQFRTCSASRMEQAQSDRGCPSAALVARGFARNIAGNINNRQDTSQRCYLSIRMWNSGSGRMALFVQGGPRPNGPSDPQHCPLAVATAIPVSVTRRATGDQIRFSIPQNLKTPLATIRNALVETRLTLLRKTVTRSGRRVGFWETFGGCRNGRRTVTAVFDNEGTADDRSQSGFARCSR
jgi:hypothetical protein